MKYIYLVGDMYTVRSVAESVGTYNAPFTGRTASGGVGRQARSNGLQE